MKKVKKQKNLRKIVFRSINDVNEYFDHSKIKDKGEFIEKKEKVQSDAKEGTGLASSFLLNIRYQLI